LPLVAAPQLRQWVLVSINIMLTGNRATGTVLLR
jgi:hypothetical protein